MKKGREREREGEKRGTEKKRSTGEEKKMRMWVTFDVSIGKSSQITVLTS